MIFRIHKQDNGYDVIESRNIIGQIKRTHHSNDSFNIVRYRNWFHWLLRNKRFLTITPTSNDESVDGTLPSPYRVKLTKSQYKASVYKSEEAAKAVIKDILANPDNYLLYND